MSLPTDPRDVMFRSYADLNGIPTSCNSHDEVEFEPPPSQLAPVSERYAYNRSTGNYEQVPPPDSLVERTRERMLNSLGNGRGGMVFEGDSLPRADRIPLDRAVSERADGLPWPALSAEEKTRQDGLQDNTKSPFSQSCCAPPGPAPATPSTTRSSRRRY